MRVKLSGKLLVIAWTLMQRKEPFNPDYLTTWINDFYFRRDSPRINVETSDLVGDNPGPLAEPWNLDWG